MPNPYVYTETDNFDKTFSLQIPQQLVSSPARWRQVRAQK